MILKRREHAERLYYLLGALFIAALITCNLIANKFIEVNLGFKTFIISAGVLPYPITFLITDILSELYGRKRTTHVVIAGFFASVFVLLILWLGSLFPAIEGSPVDGETYNQVFQNAWRVIAASMAAYLVAQLVDVRLFHFWKGLTGGKKLWVRNNFSTIISQLVDTTLVVLVLFLGVHPAATLVDYIQDGWLFKVIAAALDTFFIYAFMAWARKFFGLKLGEEIRLYGDS